VAVVAFGAACSSTPARPSTPTPPPTTTTTAVPTTTTTEGPADPLAGAWQGDLAGLDVQFTFVVADDGGYTGAFDSLSEGMVGFEVEDIVLAGSELTFVIPDIGAQFDGSLDGDVIEGFWGQSGIAGLRLERTDDPVLFERPQEPQPPFPYVIEEVAFRNPEDGFTLSGTLTKPEGAGPFPAAVLITGSGPQDRDSEILGHKPFAVIADHLTRSGVAVLRYDDRGVGHSAGSQYGATTEDLAVDAKAAFEALAVRPDIDPARIGFIGHSEGGLIAPLAYTAGAGAAFIVLLAGPGEPGATLLPAQSRLIGEANDVPPGLIEWQAELQEAAIAVLADEPSDDAAADQLWEVAMAAAETYPGGLPDEAAESVAVSLATMADPWWRFFFFHDPAAELANLDVPVLALNGTLDTQVPAYNLDLIAEALAAGGNTVYETHVLEGLNHLFQPATTGSPTEYALIETTIDPAVLDLITAWLTDRFA
jgi:pimeloyl-ACP methyl ester carboxylesterase